MQMHSWAALSKATSLVVKRGRTLALCLTLTAATLALSWDDQQSGKRIVAGNGTARGQLSRCTCSRRATDVAEQLQPTLSEGHDACGQCHGRCEGDVQCAMRECDFGLGEADSSFNNTVHTAGSALWTLFLKLLPTLPSPTSPKSETQHAEYDSAMAGMRGADSLASAARSYLDDCSGAWQSLVPACLFFILYASLSICGLTGCM